MRNLKLVVGILLLFVVLISEPAQAVKVFTGDDTIQITKPISIAIVQPLSPPDFDLVIERVVALPPEEEW